MRPFVPLLSIAVNILCAASLNTVSHKTLQLHDLQEVAQKINRLKPLGNYFVAVPSFVTLTTQDIEQFLAGVPAGIKDRRGNIQTVSILNHIKTLWQTVVNQTNRFNEITPTARESLIELRRALQIAFKHDLLNSTLNKHIKSFIERNIQQHNSLIIRSATTQPLFGAKSIYPVSARHINRGIANTLSSYFNENTITEMMAHGPLNPSLHLEVILQSMIMEDKNAKSLVVSGVSCSYDTNSNIPNIISIESIFGHTEGIKDQNMAPDKYFLHNGVIYPVIAKKPNRYVPDFDMQHVSLKPNPETIKEASTLDPFAAQEIARAAQLLEELYDRSVCVSFIKRDNTIYLIKIQTPALQQPKNPTYFDPMYTKKIAPDRKAEITPIQPLHELAVIKKRDKLILAPNIRTFLELLNKRENPEEVALGVIKERPADWSKERNLLAQAPIPVIWSPEFSKIRGWIDQNMWPLVLDPQQKIAFPFKRCKGFCTLYQAIENGIHEHPLPHQLSLLPTFLPALNTAEREQLNPEEHFPGVRMNHLFNLLKNDTYKNAMSALNTILFRLNNSIILDQITKKECALNKEAFDEAQLQNKQEIFQYVERIALQLLEQLARWHESNKLPTDNLEKNFLINLLDALIHQKPHDRIAHTASFNHSKTNS